MIPGVITFLSGKCLRAQTEQIIKLAVGIQVSHMANMLHMNIADSFSSTNSLKRTRLTNYLILGDALAALALSGLSRAGQQIVKTLSEAGFALCEGAYIEASFNRSCISSEMYRVIVKKYASFFTAAAVSGALAAQGSRSEIASLASFGRFFGAARKIRDDIANHRGLFRLPANRSDLVANWTQVIEAYADKAKENIRTLPQSFYTRELAEIAESMKLGTGSNDHPKSFMDECTIIER